MRSVAFVNALIVFLSTLSAAEKPYTFDLKWGAKGSGPGQFVKPTGIAVDSEGAVYVVDQGNHRIQKFDADGKFITTWGSKGTGSTRFRLPHSVATGPDGTIHVTDWANCRVQTFDKAGQFLAQWGSPGDAEGELKFPAGIAVDAAGDVYVADRDNRRVQRLRTDGAAVARYVGYALLPVDVAVGPGQRLYVLSQNDAVWCFNDPGQTPTTWWRSGDGDGRFSDPRGIAVDSAGNVFVADSRHHRVQKLTSGGRMLVKWGRKGRDDGEFNFPYDVAVAPSGYVYVVDKYNHRVQRFQQASD